MMIGEWLAVHYKKKLVLLIGQYLVYVDRNIGIHFLHTERAIKPPDSPVPIND